MTASIDNLEGQKNGYKTVLELIYHSRFTDEKMGKLVKQNKGATFQLSAAGHELLGVVCAQKLVSGKDWGLPYYRDQPFAVGLGCPLVEIFAAFFAKELKEHSGGRMMPGHFSHKKLNIPCQSSVVGSQFLHAVGVAHALRYAKKDDVVYVSAGDGATSQGDFHEALNFAAIHKLAVIFVIHDNGWAISVPVKEQTDGGSIVPIAAGFPGVEVFAVDGCDYPQIEQAMEKAVARGRQALGPSVIVAKVPRLAAHSSSDDPNKYKTSDISAEEKLRDPIVRYEQWLLNEGFISQEEIIDIRKKAFQTVEEEALKAESYPDPKPENATKNVFIEGSFNQEMSVLQTGDEKIVIMDALNHAIDEEMQRDPSIIVFGQDVAHGKGGVFGITRGLTAKFGKERCFNTPLAESTIVGLAIGQSMTGLCKPVAEVQFADYLWTGINQLFNELASIHYRSNGLWTCPVVLRMPCGGYIQGGPYHSQSIEAYLAHCPGLVVAIPSNAQDAKGLLKSAIRNPNPVVFLEHKALYRQQKFCARAEPTNDYLIPFGQANIVREGTDVTIIAWGMMVVMANDVAEKLLQEGLSVEVIDLRTIVPLDKETIIKSIQKTGKLLIVHEAARNCGFGAEIAAMVSQDAFRYLDAPVVRVCGKDSPVPYSKILEEAVLPQEKELLHAVRDLASF
ncbi:MAG: MFS transporter [Parachlamydiales bacterium]|nr:MFS transporter [Parachlamydiales bacterium]